MCLIKSHALTASTPTLTIVVIQSGLFYLTVRFSVLLTFYTFCFLPIYVQVSVLSGVRFSVLFILYILFSAHIFTSFSAFMYSLLSDDLCWLLIGYSRCFVPNPVVSKLGCVTSVSILLC